MEEWPKEKPRPLHSSVSLPLRRADISRPFAAGQVGRLNNHSGKPGIPRSPAPRIPDREKGSATENLSENQDDFLAMAINAFTADLSRA